MSIETIQHKLESKARVEAKRQVAVLIGQLSWHLGDYQFKHLGNPVSLSSFDVLKAIEKKHEDSIYENLVKQYTQELIDTVENLAWLQDDVENLKRG